MARGTIRYWAAAKAAAGAGSEPYDAATLAEALATARARHVQSDRYQQVLACCSFLVDGDPVGGRDHSLVSLADDGVIEVLPPFAGG